MNLNTREQMTKNRVILGCAYICTYRRKQDIIHPGLDYMQA
jgi:hypothetical protein